jgi:hypothetical protein
MIVACVVAGAGSAAADYTFDSVGLYQSFDEMAAWTATLQAANSDIVQVVEFGRSHQDRPLLAIQLSTTPGQNDPGKPEFLFTGGVHAREVIGSESAYRLAEHLVNSYRAGSSAAIDILAEREVWIVPTLNPDGRIRVENGLSRQRKNMEWFEGQSNDDTAVNYYTRGVDLNRNFPHLWSYASPNPNDETFRGSSPLSAPEAAALWSLLHDENYFSDMMAALDFHSGIESVLTPWLSYTHDPLRHLPEEDREKFEHLAGEMSGLTGYPINTLNKNTYGSIADSIYAEFGAYAMIEELFMGAWDGDYFRLFNPIDQLSLDATITKAIDSSMFLLSDQAFAITPEPTAWLLAICITAWLTLIRHRR